MAASSDSSLGASKITPQVGGALDEVLVAAYVFVQLNGHVGWFLEYRIQNTEYRMAGFTFGGFSS
jgi:hypothetical protein